MSQTLKTTDIMATGLMTFALFLGAGNIIFPPFLGYMAGTELVSAIMGFLLTGVGLPLLGVLACARVGGGLEKLTKVFPEKMALIFAVVLFLAIGPLFAAPRTAVVSYELGLLPFIGESSGLSLALFSLVFFAVALYLALFPGRLLETVGKLITPMLVAVLVLIAIGAFMFPQGEVGIATESMIQQGFFNGFREGYQTMDTLGALVFGVVIINAIHSKGVTESKQVARYTFIAGLIAAVGLSLVYLVLGYIGSTSHSLIAQPQNGAEIISLFVDAVFGVWGKAVLAITVILACLTTAVGLLSACGEYFSRVMPALSYRGWVVVCALASALIANVGLNTLLTVTIPALLIIYPIAIALILVTLLKPVLTMPGRVMLLVLAPVGLISLIEGLHAAGVAFVNPAYQLLAYLPLQAEGLVWLMPGVLGGVLGVLASRNTAITAEPVQG
ncbi:branched-chain amino acid transport system II carrier protein [Endozoicomonas ascidiicola]|uniref:branched-chain amino acid transport system II carrier protein n=1 Tax=Endozoicomonas ascidiicola TaxID=1698521 RepID=UPI00082FDE29|nr:branched-chain amino acid transport system II carrier protein [Endozoicomonas ascidiicola]